MSIAFERLALDETSWVDVARGHLAGHDLDAMRDEVLAKTPWQGSKLFKFDHWVEENRLGAMWQPGRGVEVPHPALLEVHRSLQHHYGVRFDGFAILQYRNGGDGQAFHRDRDMRWCEDTLIGILTLGATRPWLLRPRANRNDHSLDMKGATHDLAPAAGDLFVLGGRAQADWEHSVPPVRRPVGVRLSMQWRWTSKAGKPEVGASYRAPQHYSRRR